jgi:hypothetical protein
MTDISAQAHWSVTNIVWDTDGVLIDPLPTSYLIPESDVCGEDDIAEWLSDKFDWLISSLTIEHVEPAML